MYMSGMPSRLQYPGLGILSGYTEADFTAAIQSLRGYAQSVSQGKQQYEETGDPRALQQVQTMMPYLQSAIQKANTINQALYNEQLPSSWDMFLADSLSWLTDAIAATGTVAKNVIVATGETVQKVPKAVENIFSIPVLLVIGGVAFLALGGSKYLPKRKTP